MLLTILYWYDQLSVSYVTRNVIYVGWVSFHVFRYNLTILKRSESIEKRTFARHILRLKKMIIHTI